MAFLGVFEHGSFVPVTRDTLNLSLSVISQRTLGLFVSRTLETANSFLGPFVLTHK